MPAPLGAPLTAWGGSAGGTDYGVQVLNDDGEQVATGQISIYNNGTYQYARCT